ncbi:hypothetical protein SLS58_010297 [Diplodia intermedia]|uniref:Uncharacterized protein n=1 Tax=Diplodia intermedia TaxID=856260 RepID=A0ABR3T795_9PEZI
MIFKAVFVAWAASVALASPVAMSPAAPSGSPGISPSGSFPHPLNQTGHANETATATAPSGSAVETVLAAPAAKWDPPKPNGRGLMPPSLQRRQGREWRKKHQPKTKDLIEMQPKRERGPEQKCYESGQDVKRKDMIAAIKEFCFEHDGRKLKVGQSIRSQKVVQHNVIYNVFMNLYVENMDVPAKYNTPTYDIVEYECLKEFHRSIDDCNKDTEANKEGGYIVVDYGPTQVMWRIDPNAFA